MNAKNMVELFVISMVFVFIATAALFVVKSNFSNDFDALTGRTITSVFIQPGLPAYCNSTFYEGWNLVSFFCITTYEPIDSVLNDSTGQEIIFTYRVDAPDDPWKIYNPSLPAWVKQDLTYMSRVDAYWIYFNMSKVRENLSLNYTPTNISYYKNGSKRNPSYVSIYDGWNLIGYPSNVPKNISFAFLDLNNDYSEIRTYNNTENVWYYYYNDSVNTFDTFTKDKGYWVRANNSNIWVVSW
jgi:hypothetical protein